MPHPSTGPCGPHLAGALVCIALAASPARLPAAEPTYADVAPIFQQRCVLCHAGANAPRGLRLDTLADILAGGSNGAVVRPGAPADSELVRRITGASVPRMPMTGPPYLSDEQTTLIERWIAGGLAAAAATPERAPDDAPAPEPGPATWDRVAPILATRCAKCHTDGGLMGDPPENYRLTSHAGATGAADRLRVVPGNPGASELLRRIRGHSLPRMPFDGPPWLSDEEVALVASWIRDGARDGQGRPTPVAVGARLRFEGTLTARWEVDGTPVSVSRATRIDGSPRVGDRVRVRGRVDAGGRVMVERLRRR